MSSALAAGKRKRVPKSGKVRRGVEISILSLPAIIVFVVFVILPIVLAIFYYGLYSWKGFGSPQVNGRFVGLNNFWLVITDPAFQQGVLHNLIIAVLSLIFQGPIAILFALLLNQKFKLRGLVRTLIFVPYVVSEVIVGTGWGLMLSDTSSKTPGAINALLRSIGIQGPNWLSDPHTAIWTLMIVITWKYIGFAVILMIAGMQAIPEELYEAARVDGAGFWQMQRRITLPLLAPTIRIWAFLSIIGSLQLFDLVYIIWGQYNSDNAGVSTMATYMVRQGKLAGEFGYGSAVAAILFIISLIIALLYQHFILNRDLEGAITDESSDKKKDKKDKKKKSKSASYGMPVAVEGAQL
jgi:raffinose/stachyose/melibiose transport system permease protein